MLNPSSVSSAALLLIGMSVNRALTASSASSVSVGADISGYACLFPFSIPFPDRLPMLDPTCSFSLSLPPTTPKMPLAKIPCFEGDDPEPLETRWSCAADVKSAAIELVDPSALMFSFEDALLR